MEDGIERNMTWEKFNKHILPPSKVDEVDEVDDVGVDKKIVSTDVSENKKKT